MSTQHYQTMVALLPNLSEDGAFILFYAMCQKYGWAGTIFTRADAEQAWNTERFDGPYDESAVEPMPEDVWDAFLCSWAWRKGLPERLTELGWEIVADAARDVVEQMGAGNE